MTTLHSLINELQVDQADKELHWLTAFIITPEFPQIIEALQICSNLLLYNSPQHPNASKHVERGPVIKLPVSSSKSEALKGIIVRDGAYITQLTVTLKEHHFNKHITRLHLKKPILLPQIITAKKAIDSSIEIIEGLTKLTDCSDADHQKLIDSFNDLLSNIITAKNALQLPTDPDLVFPINKSPADAFEPELLPCIAVDLYITQAEVCIDLKSLHKVTERPWGEIEATSGKSYIDKIRDEMKLPSASASMASTTTSEISHPLNVSDIEKRLNEMTGHKEKSFTEPSAPAGILTNMMTSMSHLSLRPKHDPIDYITKCVTYNNMVVMINKKIEVSSADPVLVSAFTKLDSIEYLVSSFISNLDSLVGTLK
ncbi:RAVE subunit 2/Rogdi [Scheffersomyces xylosifermentans]|uniref:RAVE subunit 2/Rogdi n=1 Tax=Scheffersomyces xylosifermentans TaxID=1304137 RepID=UPI00315DF8B4